MVCVVRRLPGRQRVIGAHAQVEHQRQSMAVPNRPGLMGAVRIESGVGQFGGFLDVGLNHGFPLPVPNDQLAASAFGRQSDGQGRDHAVCLLRIPMRGEEAALFVDQQLVQAGFEAFDSAAESLRRSRHDAGEGVRPRRRRRDECAPRQSASSRAPWCPPACPGPCRTVLARQRPAGREAAPRARGRRACPRPPLPSAAWAQTGDRGCRSRQGGRWNSTDLPAACYRRNRGRCPQRAPFGDERAQAYGFAAPTTTRKHRRSIASTGPISTKSPSIGCLTRRHNMS